MRPQESRQLAPTLIPLMITVVDQCVNRYCGWNSLIFRQMKIRFRDPRNRGPTFAILTTYVLEDMGRGSAFRSHFALCRRARWRRPTGSANPNSGRDRRESEW